MIEMLWRGVAGQLLWVLVALAGAAILPGRSLGDRLGLGPGRMGPARIAVALLGFLALSNGIHRAIVGLGWFEDTSLAEIDHLVREASPSAPMLVLLAIGLAPALGEELLFRGLLLRWLAIRLAGPAAVLSSALVFGVAHLDPVHGVAAFGLGAYLGALAWRAGSLRVPILCHAANNSLAVLGSQGLVPELGDPANAWLAVSALALAAACLAVALGGLQPAGPPADPAGDSHEEHTPGPDGRRR